MKKKLLIAAFIAAFAGVFAFAAGADVSFNSSSVSVRNPVAGTLTKVELCVTVKDSNDRTTTETWTFYNVTGNKQTQNARPGTTILGAYATFCPMPTVDK